MKNAMKVIFLLFSLSNAAWAFMPAGGLWVVDAENNGQPGRGFQIEVENEIMLLTYYGYRADGSSVFYLAAGPIVGNSFSGALEEYQNGKALGTTWKPASTAGSAGTVNATFTSGLHGTITFPGESPKAISKLSFGYGNTQDGLLGSYLFTYIASTFENNDIYTLTTKAGATTDGNGLVANASYSFGCENVVSGVLAGSVVCVESPSTSYSDSYFFKMSGDRGAGVGTYTDSPYYYPLHVLRTATRTGVKTGVNDSTTTSLDAYRGVDIPPAEVSPTDRPKTLESGRMGGVDLNAEEKTALSAWADEARRILSRK